MELRSGRRLGSLPTPGPRHRRRSPAFSDRISALPDEMLLQILARLRCARAAAHTSGLSRRWRGLWRHLPELSFRDISADALLDALGQVACPALSLLEVDIPEKHTVMDPTRVSALLSAAARLSPADLVFSLPGYVQNWNIPIEIPCFERATSVKLDVRNLLLIPPAGDAMFPLLERLSVACIHVDTAELVLWCPRLHVFEVSCSAISTERVKVHSPTIEELVVTGHLDNIDIVAPVLKRFSLMATRTHGFTASFSAPMVESLSWCCSCYKPNAGFGDEWRLRDLNLEMKENVGVLFMSISAYFPNPGGTPPAYWSFSQEIAQLPAFSFLELDLVTQSHGFGALVSHLLGICSTIKALKVDITKIEGKKTCKPNCDCDQPQNWRNEVISMTSLEDVEITGFGGTDPEVDLLKLLFRGATLMERMTVVWAPECSPTFGDWVLNAWSVLSGVELVRLFGMALMVS